MQKFSYHTHTVFSDGANTADEMLARAAELGWEEIGISDHLIIHKNVKKAEFYEISKHFVFPEFKSALPVLQRNIETIRKAAKNHPLKVLVGFEVDYFTYNGWEEEFREILKQLDVDYVHNGNHYYIPEDNSRLIEITSAGWEIPNSEMLKEYIIRHFQTITKAIQSGLFDFIAHLDYARWGGSMGRFDFQPDRREVIEALAQTNTAYELSTKGLYSIYDFYPAHWMIEELKAKNVPVVISDDAHFAENLGRNFIEAEALLSELNYKNRFRL